MYKSVQCTTSTALNCIVQYLTWSVHHDLQTVLQNVYGTITSAIFNSCITTHIYTEVYSFEQYLLNVWLKQYIQRIGGRLTINS